MDLAEMISVLMMVIAIASTIIAFAVYRSASDPEVIVFADTDRKRPSILVLKIKNIGNSSAKDIRFESDRPLPKKAFGIDTPSELPLEMDDGPLIIGVPYLAPNQELIVTWGQYGGLKKFIGNRPILIKSKYSRANKLFFQKRKLESESKLDIASFGLVDNSDHNWDKKLVKELEKTNSQLKIISVTLKKATEVNKNQNGAPSGPDAA